MKHLKRPDWSTYKFPNEPLFRVTIKPSLRHGSLKSPIELNIFDPKSTIQEVKKWKDFDQFIPPKIVHIRFFFFFRKPLQTPFLTPDLQWWISAKMGYVTYRSHKGFYKSRTGVDWWMYYVASTITPIDMTDIVISINDNIKHLLNNTHHKKKNTK